MSPGALPTLNAILNGSAGLCLVTGWLFVRKGDTRRHRLCMITAFCISCAFLASYLVHHARVGSVPFRGQGLLRSVYLAILGPHVILAACVPPLACVTLYLAARGQTLRHRKLARWTLPIWLYVSVSGVAIYAMLYHLPT